MSEVKSVWSDDAAYEELIGSVAAMRERVGGESWHPTPKAAPAETVAKTSAKVETAAHDLTELVFNHIDEVLAEVA